MYYLKKRKIFLLLRNLKNVLACLSFICLTTNKAHSYESQVSIIENSYAKYCNGQFVEFNRELKAIKQDQPDYISGRLLAMLTAEGLEEALLFKEKAQNDLKSLSEFDRIILAAALVRSNSKDINLIKDLLSFNSSNIVLESYRLSLESYLDDLNGNAELSLKKKIDAFNGLQFVYFDAGFLADIFTSASADRSAELILSPYFSYIEKLSDDDPTKFLLLAWKNVVISKGKNQDAIISNFKKAYELCKFDPVHALNYVPILIYKGQVLEAEIILLDIIKINKYYNPYIDYYLSKIYLSKGNNEKAEVFLTKAEVNKLFLAPDYQKDLAKLMSEQASHNYWFWYAFLGIILVAGVAFLIFKKVVKN